MQTILGAGGTIGLHLAKALQQYTNEVRLVSRNPQKVNDSDELFPADLTNREQVFKAVKGAEVTYLTVGLPYKYKVWQQNWPLLMQHVIEACSEYRSKLVFFDNVYMIGGNQVRHITETSPISPTSRKGVIRAELDDMIMKEVEKGRLQAIIARSADFYGAEGNNSILIELIYKNLKKNKKAQWFFNAKTKHSFTYTPDAGKATALLGNTPEAYNQIWNLPTDSQSLSGEEWIRLFAAAMNKDDRYQLLPAWAVKGLGFFIPFLGELHEMRYQYDRDYFFESSKFCNYFKVAPTSYQQGVREIINTVAG